ncbi:glycosyltransferase [Sphaerotilus mobilis]|uniref:Putative glycosyltransferase n=1 Tax=Sphaerotilus mobilis TaxID=47994 RepID=A0A4Q7LRP7_9BURK|nr:glycosyltransferase [Sphaerotilus mobilis]RZS56827.1 putative glycosyltransferase [Sphaerotilus mobilis]
MQTLTAHDTAPRLLFQVRNRRGLGHMMRGLNIAAALRRIRPDARIDFHLRTAPGAGFWPDDLGLTVEDAADPAHPTRSWQATVERLDPDVIVFDTLLPAPDEVGSTRAALAFVMRECLPDEQRALHAHPLMDRIARFIVPHEALDYGPVPAALADRTHCVGTIRRRTSPAAQQALRQRLGLADGAFVLTSTVGGGGFTAQAERFFEVVRAAHRSLQPTWQAAGRPVEHLLILGPNYAGTVDPLPGLRVLAAEPELVSLLALSDLVIAEGGYNTVNEILDTHTPALFLPSARGKDDQHGRVQVLADAGRAEVLDATDPQAASLLAQSVRTLLDDPQRLGRMRLCAARLAPPRRGNEAAAQLLHELARTRLASRGVQP